MTTMNTPKLEKRSSQEPDKDDTAVSTTTTNNKTNPPTVAAAVDTIEERLAQVTMEADHYATRSLSLLLFPLIFASILYSLFYDKHASWYSWILSSLTSCVYTFGFITMCPQLYINHRLQSVSHLPWQYLIYKFLNTFVDGK